MNKLDLESKKLVSDNISKIKELFPNVVTEGENGLVIDFDLLKHELSSDIVEGVKERYQLTWPGKKEAINNANTPTNKTLRPLKDKSVDFDKTNNIYIEGDNLEVLKVLCESYVNKVNCIYIDPPYNTGENFIYNDSFYKDKHTELYDSGLIDELGNKFISNSRSNGKFHSDWLKMMYSRLKISHNFLKHDGVIFISIDDEEYCNMKLICDEIFGYENFIASIVRNTNSSKNQSLFVSVSHEYCLVYTKNMEMLKEKHKDNKWSVPKNNLTEYISKISQLKKEGLTDLEITSELKTLTKYPRFIDFTNYWYFDKRGLYRKDNLGGVKNGNLSPIVNPLTGNDDIIPPGGYRYNQEKLNELIQDDRIHFHNDGSLPTLKRYLHENEEQRPKSIMSDDQRPDYSMLKVFQTPFDNPKQLDFMKRILNVLDKDSIILDFFSGSATTAHATMQLNAEDGGNRRFIMVQLPEMSDLSKEAKNLGFSNICEIGQERIRRAGKKIKEDNPNANIDTGFRVYKLDSSNIEDVNKQPNEYTQGSLDLFAKTTKEDRTPEDLLTQVILDLGLTLDLPIEEKTINNNKVFFVAGNSLVACFDDNLELSLIDELCKVEPLKVVFKESSFKDDATKLNVETKIKKISPNTIVSVM